MGTSHVIFGYRLHRRRHSQDKPGVGLSGHRLPFCAKKK